MPKMVTVYIDDQQVTVPQGTVVVDAAKKAGFEFVDAPVSGGQAGAENGVLTVMCGGDEPIFARAEKIISPSYARACNLMGKPGAGQLAKMVNQICIAGLVQGLSEAIAFGAKAGLGYRIVISGNSFDTAGLFAGILLFAVAGVISVELLKIVERRLAPYRFQVAES